MNRRTALILAVALLVAPAAAPPPARAAEHDAERVTDIDALYAFMKATHPDLYHHTSQKEMEAYIAGFRRETVADRLMRAHPRLNFHIVVT